MLKVFSLYDSNPPTDGIIFNGIHNILDTIDINTWTTPVLKVPDKYDHQSIDMVDLPDDCFLPNEKFDIILIPGTPWLWDMFNRSPKYRNLIKCLKLHPEAKRIFFGIGSCLSLDVPDIILKRPEEKAAMSIMFKDALVIVRDNVAYNKVKNIGIDVELLPCPSYFCYGRNPQEPTIFNDNILIWYNPLTGLSRDLWKRQPDRFKSYMNIISNFYNTYSPIVYTVLNCKTHLDDDIELTKSIGINDINIIKNSDHTKDIMQNANIILSGRVHCSVPAYVCGKSVSVLRIDSRANTLTDFGGNENGNFCKVGKKDFSTSFDRYITLINDYLNK